MTSVAKSTRVSMRESQAVGALFAENDSVTAELECRGPVTALNLLEPPGHRANLTGS